VPEYVEDYFLRAFRRLGGTVERRGETYAIPSVPFELRRWGDDYSFKTTYGTIFREYRRVTFDKAHARAHPETEFVAPGHPLLEAVNQQILTTFSDGTDAYAVFGDPEGNREGVLWFVEGDVTDGAGQPAGKRVFCLYQPVDGMIQQVNPAVLWDHEPLPLPGPSPREEEGGLPVPVTELLQQREVIEDHVVTEVLLPFREEIAERRERETRVKEKYGLRSLDYLIQESNQKILDYQMRQAVGEQVDLPLLNEQRNLEQLQQRRAELEREIRLERNLTVGEPRIIGAAAVVPLRAAEPETEPEGIIYEPHTPGIVSHYEERAGYEAGLGMRRDEEIEAAGMQVAMDYERGRGWHPEDVSGENHGFDVRSTLYEADGTFADIRYVEVKARACSGAIRLSANEWKKARHFNDKFWLYIVTEAATDAPQLHRIQNPAAWFRIGEDIFATGFIIHEKTWREKTRSE
jgi:hypothetical protein